MLKGDFIMHRLKIKGAVDLTCELIKSVGVLAGSVTRAHMLVDGDGTGLKFDLCAITPGIRGEVDSLLANAGFGLGLTYLIREFRAH